MPVRKIPLVTDELYHLFNRGVSSIRIFNQKKDYQRFTETLLFYQNNDPPLKFSAFTKLSRIEKENLQNKLWKQKNHLAEIIAYCLMPNHFHFIFKQLKDDGITNLLRLLGDSFSHYFNTKYQRKGPLFEGRFKAVRIETDAQLLHLSRYIHLNPYSSFLIKKLEKLINYPYSSFPEYLGKSGTKICQKEIILSSFKSVDEYQQFVFDQANYQRTLQEIKHQLLE